MSEDNRGQDDLDFTPPRKGISRRDFLKYCGLVAAALGLDATFIPRIAQAWGGTRPPIIWLQFAECTGCTESFLRSTNPFIDDIIFGAASLEYHETLMAPSGQNATQNLLNAAINYRGQFICICEGAIPTADNGVYGMIGGKTMLQIAKDICPKAKAVISFGACASYGGLPAASGNLTGARGVHKALGGYPTINIPGCPPNPITLVATLTTYLLNGSFPQLDGYGRPLFAYGTTNHEHCERKLTCSDKCLYYYGCRGRTTFNNCSSVKFNNIVNTPGSPDGCWPVQVNAPCYGCSEPRFWDRSNFFFYNGHYTNACEPVGP
jgi:[NiFe] hydrogenase small subunit